MEPCLMFLSVATAQNPYEVFRKNGGITYSNSFWTTWSLRSITSLRERTNKQESIIDEPDHL